MKIEIIPCLSDNYSYLIFEKNTNTVSIVDPSEFSTCDSVIKKYKKTFNEDETQSINLKDKLILD